MSKGGRKAVNLYSTMLEKKIQWTKLMSLEDLIPLKA